MNRVVFVGLMICFCFLGFGESNRPAECELEHEIGPCRALIPAYYYDSLADECVLFYYGGCSGTKKEQFDYFDRLIFIFRK